MQGFIDLGPGDCGFVGLGAGANCYQRREPFDNLYDNSWHHFVITYSGEALRHLDIGLTANYGLKQGVWTAPFHPHSILLHFLGCR